MADGQQRLLDVIDDVFSSDPNALESFLGFGGGQCTSLESETFDILDIAGSGCSLDTRGGLTSSSDLLPSVDNVVASLAHSLAADYEVDSPNDTLFDNCLEASSNTLTDISQSYVPSDFDNANYTLSNGLSQQQQQLELVSTNGTNGGQLSFCTSQTGTTTTVNSGGGGASGDNINVLVNSTLQQQYGNNICDSTSTFVHSSQQQQQQNTTTTTATTTTTTSNSSFNEPQQQNFSHLTDLQCTQPQNVSQIPSLSSTSSNNNNCVVVNNHDIQNSSTSNNESVTATTTLSSTTNSSDLISSVATVASSANNSSNNNQHLNNNNRNCITTGIVSTFTQPSMKDVSVLSAQKNICGIITNAATTTNNCELPASSNNNISNNSNIQIQIQQQTPPPPQQFIVSAAPQNINQLVSHQGQTVSLANMTMSPQLMTTNSAGGLISSVIGSGHHQGTTNLMQIQSAPGQPQQFITITEQPQTLNLGNLGAFGGNLANLGNLLVATGGGTQYAVLPTGSQIFSNLVQSQKIHQATGQTFFQTPSGSIVAANSIQSLQGVQNVNISNISTTTTIRAKQPQLLPKPTTLNTAAATVVSNLTQPVSNNNSNNNNNNLTSTLCSSSGDNNISNNSGATVVGELQQQHSVTVNNMGQIQIQQQQVQQTNAGINNIVTSLGSNLSQSPFTIGNASGIGQVMVSGVSNMNSMTQPQQAHLTGTIVLNQFGQPVLLPTAGNNNGLQLILRQQPAQPQVLTLGAPAAQATQMSAGIGKPIVRYVPQMPQNQTVQIQQIQTSNGPAFIAVRCPPTTTSQTSFVSPQIQSSEPILSQPVQPSNNSTLIHPHTINTIRQQTIGSLTSQNQSQITIKTEKAEITPNQQQQINSSAIPDSSSEIPPIKKKPSKSKKKKVTLDLDEILKKFDIGDEDLQDDSCFENSLPSEQQHPAELMNGYQSIHPINNNLTSTPEPIKPNGCLTKPQNLPVNILPPHVHVLKPSTHQPSNKNQRNSVNNNSVGAGSSRIPPSKKPSPPKPKPKSAPKRKAPPEKIPFESPPAKQSNLAPHLTTPPNKKNSPKTTNMTTNNNNRKKSNANTAKKTSPTANSQKSLTNNKTTSVPTSSFTSPSELVPSTIASTPSSISFNNNTALTSTNTAARTTNNAGAQRIVHTIQLTPQNQQLLRNIQAQISRLAALPSRNENEQTALQKLIFLQQQVIATGTPVAPNASQLQNANTINNDSTLTVQATTTHNILLSKEITNKETSKEKTEVTKNLSADDGEDKGSNNGTNCAQPYSSTVLVVEDSKALEQRRAAAKAEEEARNRWKKEQFDFLLKRDQDFFVKPDYKTPFSSKQDAVERLMKYHIARDRTEMDFEDFDAEFSDTAVRLLDKFSGMVTKYKTLLLKESMKEVSCAERVMVERTFCNEEKVKLDQDRLLVAQGEFPELPPPPSTWVPKLREMVDADVREMELNSAVNQQVESAVDSILFVSSGTNDSMNQVPDESEKIEYDAFGVPTSGNPSYVPGSSSADIDEAVRSIIFS